MNPLLRYARAWSTSLVTDDAHQATLRLLGRLQQQPNHGTGVPGTEPLACRGDGPSGEPNSGCFEQHTHGIFPDRAAAGNPFRCSTWRTTPKFGEEAAAWVERQTRVSGDLACTHHS
jgi:hypothetical protein